jgi:hypothetical protein
VSRRERGTCYRVLAERERSEKYLDKCRDCGEFKSIPMHIKIPTSVTLLHLQLTRHKDEQIIPEAFLQQRTPHDNGLVEAPL